MSLVAKTILTFKTPLPCTRPGLSRAPLWTRCRRACGASLASCTRTSSTDLDSSKLDSSARTKHWLLFLKILPRAFRIPIQAALASHSWRDAIILFQDGSHQACATTHEFIATFLTRVCVPVLTPDAFDAWVSTTAIDVNDAWHKNIDAIIEAVGLDIAKRVVVKEQSTWRGRASTIKIVSE